MAWERHVCDGGLNDRRCLGRNGIMGWSWDGHGNLHKLGPSWAVALVVPSYLDLQELQREVEVEDAVSFRIGVPGPTQLQKRGNPADCVGTVPRGFLHPSMFDLVLQGATRVSPSDLEQSFDPLGLGRTDRSATPKLRAELFDSCRGADGLLGRAELADVLWQDLQAEAGRSPATTAVSPGPKGAASGPSVFVATHEEEKKEKEEDRRRREEVGFVCGVLQRLELHRMFVSLPPPVHAVHAHGRQMQMRSALGLGPNLAYFVLRYGHGAIFEADAPVVFVNGVFASLPDLCATHITEDAVRSARLILEVESQPRRDMRERGRPQRITVSEGPEVQPSLSNEIQAS
eukprot:Skav214573  [mRNA]  locus=scaffold57:55151:61195:+ [translate_table: standard]